MRRGLAIAALLAIITSAPATAETVHAISMHGAPKYAADFQQLSYVDPAAPKGGTLRLAKTGSFDTLNNNIIMGTAAEGLEHLNDRLMQRVWDEPFSLYGLVAESIDVSEDRSQITFHLRPEARFHDGRQMTTEDVAFTFDMLRQHGHPVRRRVYGLVQDVDILSPQSIRFTFGPGYDRESVMILAIMPVLPKHYWEGADITKTTLKAPLGSGPYKIKTVEPGRRIVYERVADWWARDLPVVRGLFNFDTITYTYFRDDSVSMQSLMAGQYDLRREYDIGNWTETATARPVTEGRLERSEIIHQRPEWLKAMIYNTRRPLFSDIRIRRALGLMFNAEWVNTSLYAGGLQRLDSSFANSELAPPQTPPTAGEAAVLEPFATTLTPAVFGPAWQPPHGALRERQREALRLLGEAGWQIDNNRMVNAKGQPLEFEILLGEARDERIALSFARDLARIGITLRVRTVDSAQFTGRLDKFDYDMVVFRWINSLSPGNEQLNYWGSAAAAANGTRNYAGVKDPAVDALAGAIAQTTDREGLIAHCHALDRVLMHGEYMIPLFYLGRDLVLHRPDIKRPATTPMYGAVLESWWQEPAN